MICGAGEAPRPLWMYGRKDMDVLKQANISMLPSSNAVSFESIEAVHIKLS